MRRMLAALFLFSLISVFAQADQIAYLNYGKLWVYESGKSRLVSEQTQYLDVKWYKKSKVAVVRAGNIELVDTTNAKTEKLTSIGNIRNILVLPDKNRILFARIVGQDSKAFLEGFDIHYYDLYSIVLDNKKISRIGRIARACKIENMFVVGSDVYYLMTVGDGDGYQDIRKISLTNVKQKEIYQTDRSLISEICSICPDKSGKQLVMLAMKITAGDATPRAVWNLFVATIDPQKPKPKPAILCRLDPSPFQSYSEVVDGSCILSDGSLVFGVRSSEGGCKLFRFSFESGKIIQIADGYRPDAISEQ
ncbi:MAG: hypothetical protein Athens101428_654 [Candidatus Berkelbacteria bacterium Athens1014_28]|uniref:Uncharacterized protein n=1 Tax=Candidatus Berkelbacteria bacterium Athens1014_28 TaxID=2017145 RepID=A0A554LL03_9BACT|nr:MAG: hypothetical protein Athens101428_654 [Candidatus Berkelbacteria bacterium Athens1014_28]